MALMLIAVVILSVMGMGLLSLGLHGRIFATRTTSEIEARAAADAGLARALAEMNEKLTTKPWDGDTLPVATDQTLPNCDATFGYTVTGDIDSGYTVESVGQSGASERTVTSILPLQGPFESAIFAKQNIDLKNNAVVDWYNYDDGDENLRIGTNSTASGAIDLKNNVLINGDIVVGIDGNPDIVINNQGATITGETYPLTETRQMPPIAVPNYLNDLPSKGTLNNNKTITTSAKYDEIDLANGKVITIDGAVILYIIGDVTLNNSAELRVVDPTVNPDASLTLYLGGDIEVKNSGAINNLAQDAKKLKIYGLDSCQNIVLKNGSDFYGAIYAPNADVEMMNSADFYGAVAADSFEQKNSAAFNYDASLRDANTNDEALRFIIRQWREK